MSNVKNFFLPSSSNSLEAWGREGGLNLLLLLYMTHKHSVNTIHAIPYV